MRAIKILLFLFFLKTAGYCQKHSNLKDNVVWLDEMNLETMETGWGQPQARATINGLPLSLGGKTLTRGIGSHAYSEYTINLHGEAIRFEALVGIDDEVKDNPGSVIFRVFKDGKKVYDSGLVREKETPKHVSINLSNAKILKLVIDGGNDKYSWDHADWGMAKIITRTGSNHLPEPLYKLPSPTPYILTPKPSQKPKINSPAIYGTRAYAPFLYKIPVTGARPITYGAKGLPPGLLINDTTGIICGAVAKKGRYRVQLSARNRLGKAVKYFDIKIGDTIALTPPLGWNHWNCFGTNISESKIKEAAEAFIKMGLVDHGWSYINIDDAWQGGRDESGNIMANQNFPDMGALGHYLHQKGLKFGIYSSPGKLTCGNFIGSEGHEKQDAETYAAWGVDYLKYDWCSCQSPDLKAPYELMAQQLHKIKRDVFFSFCQYGMGEVWKWGASAGGNSWRTSGDINDTWGSLNIGFDQNGMEPFAGPGHWNDPDMMIIGEVSTGLSLHRTRLRPDEQYTHVTLWSLLAAPMLLGCDLTKLDDFTLNLITNDEVIQVNQDQLGKQGYRLLKNGKNEVWVKPLFGGSYAVAFFNRGLVKSNITLPFARLKLVGRKKIRDIWRQKNLPAATDKFTAAVNPHGVFFFKIGG